VRAELYRYEYTVPGSEAANKGDWSRVPPLPPHTQSTCQLASERIVKLDVGVEM
jgi:hypothetical protein